MTGDAPLTVGVEEEFTVVDPATGRLANGAARILDRLDDRDACSFSSEIRATMVETATAVCDTLDTVRAQLVESRGAVVAAAEASGLAVVAAGTPPLGSWRDAEMTPSTRYGRILQLHQQVVREQIVCGCHVHVGIADRALAVEVLDRVRPWLAVLLALSASSPYWDGFDTGYASYRTTVWGRWPAADVPETFTSPDEYDTVVAALVDTETILDAGQVYWDVRLSAKQPTVEFRVADVCTTIDEAVLQAGLCRALARTAQWAALRGEPAPRVRPELLRAAKWRAARFGVSGDLLDVVAVRALPAATLVERLVDTVRPALAEAGDLDAVTALVERVLRDGTSAQRQRDVHARTGRVDDVVAALRTETAAG